MRDVRCEWFAGWPESAAGSAFGAGLLILAALGGCSEGGETRATLSVAEAMAGDPTGYERSVEPRVFSFPADHGPHEGFRTEWWYFTGNLTAEGRDFGYQLTFFRNALRPEPVDVESDWATRHAFMAHFALTDMRDGSFYAFERFQREAVELAGARGEPMRVWVEDWEARELEGGAFRIRAAEGDVELELVLEPAKPPVLQGEGGLSQKGPEAGNASYYYSMTRLVARGTVGIGADRYEASGLSWLDREWSTSALSPGLAGWDWFSLQLGDGTELMVYRLRQDDGGTAPFSAGTFVAADGSRVPLSAREFVLEETGSWSSPRGGSYPSGWEVRVPSLGLALTVEPRLRDQELDLAFRYWEGAVAVEGERNERPVAGRGYVELTGYADGSRP